MSTDERTILRFTSLQDLLDEQPWFQEVGSDRLVAHAQALTEDEFSEFFSNKSAFELVWLDVPTAMARVWTSLQRRTPFFDAYTSVLSDALGEATAQQEKTELVEHRVSLGELPTMTKGPRPL